MMPIVITLRRSEERPVCDSQMLDPTTRKLRCDRMATYLVDGKPMCKRHAGSYLVDTLADVSSPKSTLDTDETNG